MTNFFGAIVYPMGSGTISLNVYLGTSYTLNKQSTLYYNLTATDQQGNGYTGTGLIIRGELIVENLKKNNI